MCLLKLLRIVRDFTIRSNTNGLGLWPNAIKDLYPLILHQLVVGWIGKAHSPTVQFEIIISKVCNIHGTKKFIARCVMGAILEILGAKFVVRPKSVCLSVCLSVSHSQFFILSCNFNLGWWIIVFFFITLFWVNTF